MSSQTSTSTAHQPHLVACSEERVHHHWCQKINNTINMNTKQVAPPQHARISGYGAADRLSMQQSAISEVIFHEYE